MSTLKDKHQATWFNADSTKPKTEFRRVDEMYSHDRGDENKKSDMINKRRYYNNIKHHAKQTHNKQGLILLCNLAKCATGK